MSELVPARVRESKTHIIPGKLEVTELLFEVPIDYANLSAGTIQVFARSATRYENPVAPRTDEERQKKSQKPWFVYLQGGPGCPCSPPQDSWITDIVLDKGYQLLFLDQRGTGLSTPVSSATLALQGDVHKQADYLKLFRADSIVKDCEAIRKTLTAEYPEELKKWSIFGQSFGGFCTLSYLSKYPQGLREAFTLGGLPPIGKSAVEVYKSTFQRVIERNKAFYAKYPEDVETIQNIAFHIRSKGGITLPSGATLSVRGFLTLGRNFGFHGGLDIIHNLVLRMRMDLSQFQFLTRPTLMLLEHNLTFDDIVLYGVLHEACYCQGQASNWAAERVGKALKEFQWLHGSPQNPSEVREHPLYFSGEMIYPFLFDNFPELEKLKPVADILAQYSDWPALYNEWQLARNEVPVYSATYVDDMYVDFGLAQNTAKMVKNLKQYITNAMYHDAVRSKTADIMKELFKLRDDSID